LELCMFAVTGSDHVVVLDTLLCCRHAHMMTLRLTTHQFCPLVTE